MATTPHSPAPGDRFADWCTQRDRLSTAQRQTVTALLEQAKTSDCQQAEQVLLKAPRLSLGNRQLTDISPLVTLPHLTAIDLSFNQITDITPLAKLTNLTFLLLAGNQIDDVTPLAQLTNLNYLVLEKNQIRDIRPLANLKRLTALIALSNPITSKRCPITPATVCIFSNDGADLFAQAEAQYQQGEFSAALTQFQAVLKVYTQADDRLKQGDTLNRIGDTSMNLGQYAQALSAYQTAIALRQELGDLPGLGVSLTSLATAYERLGQYQKAQDTLEQALQNIQQQQKGGIPLEGGIYELPKDEATLRNRLAQIQNQLEQHPAALRSAQAALKLYQLLPDDYDGKRFGERAVLDTIGLTHWYLGESQTAITTLKQAETIAKAIGDRAGLATSLNHLGEVYLSLKQPTLALDLFQQALTIRQAIGDRPGAGATLNQIGITLLQQGDYAKATQALLSAIQIWESLRPGLTDENKVSLFETQVVTYSALQNALVAQNQPTSALEIAERSRARAFVELLASRLGGKVSAQFESAAPPSIDQIRQVAKVQKATLVEYSLSQDNLLIWVIAPDGTITLRSVKLTELDTSLEDAAERTRVAAATGRNRGISRSTHDLNAFVQGTRSTVAAPSSGTIATADADDPEGSTIDADSSQPRRLNRRLRKSYDLLIAPIADLLPKDPNDHVIFLPHGSLFLIPFPALQDATGKYLIEQHTILTAPSIQVLALTHQRQRQTQTQIGQPLVVGNPTMPKLAFPVGSPPEALAPLPGAEAEAIAVARLLQTQALTADAATEAVVVAKMPTAGIVHLATHGLLDDIPQLGVPGAIALAPDPRASATSSHNTSDGFLTTTNILNLNLTANLVVLSACNTGRGSITGDGVIGLSRAFMAAGTPSVLVSLWEVPDAPTSDLMIEFYQQMQQQPNKAQALRQAMLETMTKHPHPRDWAAFTLIGQP
ncbi:CHAT domain-containing protein [Pantanalinema rosaneae CENA516]|uniref:CHAT domain-containing protein n=1 Tax=Pantanalinema rosaneae TaxID=1620701 RepID=UPI003D6E0EB2